MKIPNFLKKIKKQEQLELVEPSEEIKESYLVDSESYLSSAKTLFQGNKLKETTQLTYFSIYYSILALLFKIGIKSENHFASVILLKEVFGIDNSFALLCRKKRVATYYPDFEIEKQSLKKLIKDAERFNGELLDFISRLTQGEIKIYRIKFMNLFK